jgi:hypothetical protein
MQMILNPIRPKSSEIPRPRSPSPAPIVHTKGKDRRREKPQKVIPTPVSNPESQTVTPTPVLEIESQRNAPELGRDYISEEEAKNLIDPNARRPKEHFRIWGKRLVQRWKELDLGDHDISNDLDGCLTLFHNLELNDPEAVRLPTLKELEKYDEPEGLAHSEVEQQDAQKDSEAGLSPSTQAHREGLTPSVVKQQDTQEEILTPKPSPFIRNAGPIIGRFQDYEFISNEDTKRWDQEQYEPEEIRLPTLAELENQLGIIAHEEVLVSTQQDKNYMTYEVQEIDRVEDIHFKECPVRRDLERPHQNRSLMSKWMGIVPSTKNPAYAFNVPIFGHKYAEAPYIPKLISASWQKIKEVLQTELHRNDQIKMAIVVLCRYSYGSKKETEGEPIIDEIHHRGRIRPILLEEEIDGHIIQSIREIDKGRARNHLISLN